MAELIKYNDPRVTETPCRFESQPYAGELQAFQKIIRHEKMHIKIKKMH